MTGKNKTGTTAEQKMDLCRLARCSIAILYRLHSDYMIGWRIYRDLLKAAKRIGVTLPPNGTKTGRYIKKSARADECDADTGAAVCEAEQSA